MIQELLVYNIWYGFALLDGGLVELLGRSLQFPKVKTNCAYLTNIESIVVQASPNNTEDEVWAYPEDLGKGLCILKPWRDLGHSAAFQPRTPAGAETRLASKGQCQGVTINGVPVSEHVIIPESYYAAHYRLTSDGSLFQCSGKGGNVQFNPDIRVKHIYNLCGHLIALTMEGYLVAFPKSKAFGYSMDTDYTSYNLFPDYLLHKGT